MVTYEEETYLLQKSMEAYRWLKKLEKDHPDIADYLEEITICLEEEDPCTAVMWLREVAELAEQTTRLVRFPKWARELASSLEWRFCMWERVL